MKAILLLTAAVALQAEVVSNNTTEKSFQVSGAAKLVLDNVEGSVTVTGGASNQIRVIVRETWTGESEAMIQEAKQKIRIDMKQEGNTVDIYVDGPFRENRQGGSTRTHRSDYGDRRGYRAKFDFEVQVPVKTELDIATVNRGDVRVTNVQGPFEVRNVNGAIEMRDVAVGGTAHTVNGRITATFASLPTAESDFKTVNGAIHATMPPGLNADVRVKTFNGEAFTDFDSTMLPVMQPAGSREGKRFVYKSDRASSFRIGSGGVSLRFETLNGEIRIAKREVIDMIRFIVFLAVTGLATFGQQAPAKIVVPFTDPAKAKMLKVEAISGSIEVRGYAGSEVIVEVKEGEERGGRPSTTTTPPAGMRRIGPGSSDIVAEELDNVMKIRVGHSRRPTSLSIQAPANCSLTIKTLNDGVVVVEGIQGEIDANNLNGPVTLTRVSGTVIAHSLNGKVQVSMDRVEAGKPMSFSTLNGDIDVTLPAEIKANVKMKSDNGEILSDFEIAVAPAAQVETGKRDSKGMYKVSIARSVNGTINGGGQPLQFTTMNGTIYIRKRGAAGAR